MPILDTRWSALEQWVARTLDAHELEWQALASDASFRRYFRARRGDRSYIAVDAPPGREDARRYAQIARRFAELGLNVPEVLALEPDQGFVLLSDLGERLYLQALDEHSVERLYGDALGALIVLQAGVYTDSGFLPLYDEARLRQELALFVEWYLGRHLGLVLAPDARASLERVFDVLVRVALEQPRVWVHRDYHSRNLIVTARNNPGILDFQDAVLGPVTYDLVSLLRDCYIAWPRAQVEEWVKGYHDLCLQSGIPVCPDDEQFLRWFDLMGVQRHLKAAGIFARLHHRDGRPGYTAHLPRTLGYVREVSQRYPELAPLHALVSRLEEHQT